MKKILFVGAMFYSVSLLGNSKIEMYLKNPIMRHATASFIGYLASDFSKKIISNNVARLVIGSIVLVGAELYRSRNIEEGVSASSSSSTSQNIKLSTGDYVGLLAADIVGYAFVTSHPYIAQKIASVNNKIGNKLGDSVHYLKDKNILGAAGVAATGAGIGFGISKLD